MEEIEQTDPNRAKTTQSVQVAIEIAIRLGLLLLVAALCFRILAPFLEIVIWGVIVAIAADGSYEKACSAFGGRRKLVAVAILIITLIALIVPAVLLTETLISGSRNFADQVASGEYQVPPPPENVADWPVVGERIHSLWLLASENLSDALERAKPQLVAGSRWLLGAAGSAGAAVLQLVASLIIACFLLVNKSWRQETIVRFMTRIAPERGAHYTELAFATVKSVVQGIVGVAVTQAVLAGIGFLVAGIPGAGLWALLVMVAAIVQLPVFLVMVLPVLLAFSTLSTPMASLFTAWCLIVSLVDNVLKPILFGRGVKTPTIVIFLGAIGGMLSMGIIGLFLGAVILALGYELLVAWIGESRVQEQT